MPSMSPLAVAGLAALAIMAAATSPASAAIQCQGNFQVVQGQLLATPYCRDTNLAHVANQYGMRVSAHEVRQNPGVKKRVCMAIGHDNRVSEACLGYRPEDGGKRFLP